MIHVMDGTSKDGGQGLQTGEHILQHRTGKTTVNTLSLHFSASHSTRICSVFACCGVSKCFLKYSLHSALNVCLKRSVNFFHFGGSVNLVILWHKTTEVAFVPEYFRL